MDDIPTRVRMDASKDGSKTQSQAEQRTSTESEEKQTTVDNRG